MQLGPIKNLFHVFRYTHSRKRAGVGTSRFPQAQQHPDAALINTVDPREAEHQHSGGWVTEHRIAQYGIVFADHNPAFAADNFGVCNLSTVTFNIIVTC
jgi:hypothetical protein